MTPLPDAQSSDDAIALHERCAALEREIEHLRVLQHISQALVSEIEIDHLLHDILRAAIQVMAASAGALLLLDERAGELVFRVVEGGGGERLQGQRMPSHQGIAGWVLRNQRAVIVDDTQKDQRFYAEVSDSVDFGVTSMICTPMTVQGKPVGVLEVLNKRSGEHFGQTDTELLLTFAAQSAIAIRNAQLYQELLEERDRIVAVEEDVRKELARDLHDGPTQIVAAIMMNLQFVHKLMEREPGRVDAELNATDALAERAMHQLRTMLFDLRPVILETSGLVPALEAYSSRLTETERFAVHLQVEGEVPPLSKQARSAAFAVVQEAVVNVRKHAEAENIWVHVSCADDALRITVRDDGSGFDVASAKDSSASRGSMGMINMHERAEMIHGSFSIHSEAGKGTTVQLVAPISLNRQ